MQGLGVIGPLLVEPIKLRSAPWKVAKSRIELLESLNQDPGLEAGGLTVKKVMEVYTPLSLSLSHPHSLNSDMGRDSMMQSNYRVVVAS